MASPRESFNVGQPLTLTLIRGTEQLRTPVTDLLKIKHPIMLAGMNVAAGPKLAAAVTNAGGIGVVGGVGYTPVSIYAQDTPVCDTI